MPDARRLTSSQPFKKRLHPFISPLRQKSLYWDCIASV